jgi:DNA-binding beta-propeller fold protein YncE
MKKRLILQLIIILSCIIYPQQLSKVYTLSEGGFSLGSSKLSMFNVESGSFTQNIFSPGNLGLYPDGLIYYNDYLYLTEQGSFGSSGKIYKIDTLGQVIRSAIFGTNPYSLTIVNNKVYITNGPASKVSVLNLNDFSLVKNIQVGVYPQEIISSNNKVFVANISLWGGGSDSTISVIDSFSDSAIAKIVLRKDPSSLAISKDNFLLVGCPGDGIKGIIYKINPTNYNIIDSFTVPVYGFEKDISVDKNSNEIFFIANTNDIVKYNLLTRTISVVLASVYPNNYYYGYNYDFTKKQHFVLDAKNFTIPGNLIMLDSNNVVINNFQTGTAPRRVVFKYNNTTSGINEYSSEKSFSLKQNYPNPFNPVTRINWQTKIDGWHNLKVYDLLGNEIIKLVDEFRKAGDYSLEFSATNLAGGIYIYQLSFFDGQTTKLLSNKMILLK